MFGKCVLFSAGATVFGLLRSEGFDLPAVPVIVVPSTVIII